MMAVFVSCGIDLNTFPFTPPAVYAKICSVVDENTIHIGTGTNINLLNCSLNDRSILVRLAYIYSPSLHLGSLASEACDSTMVVKEIDSYGNSKSLVTFELVDGRNEIDIAQGSGTSQTIYSGIVWPFGNTGCIQEHLIQKGLAAMESVSEENDMLTEWTKLETDARTAKIGFWAEGCFTRK
jgi:hypothetical protein